MVELDSENAIEKKYFNHFEELNKINIVEYCLINRAMKKYYIQTNCGMLPGIYCKSVVEISI